MIFLIQFLIKLASLTTVVFFNCGGGSFFLGWVGAGILHPLTIFKFKIMVNNWFLTKTNKQLGLFPCPRWQGRRGGKLSPPKGTPPPVEKGPICGSQMSKKRQFFKLISDYPHHRKYCGMNRSMAKCCYPWFSMLLSVYLEWATTLHNFNSSPSPSSILMRFVNVIGKINPLAPLIFPTSPLSTLMRFENVVGKFKALAPPIFNFGFKWTNFPNFFFCGFIFSVYSFAIYRVLELRYYSYG